MRLIAILAVGAMASLAACYGGEEAVNNQSATKAGYRQAVIGPIQLEYETAKLVVATVSINLPQDAERQIRGMKLISPARQDRLDKPQCPEQEAELCRAEAEGGLTLTMVNLPIGEFTGAIRNTRPATFAGREGVTWEGRLGGKPATYTLVPIEQQTLMVIRQTGEGAPDPAALEAVIASIRVNPPAPEPTPESK